MENKNFDFNNEMNLSNTYSVFEDLVFMDENEMKVSLTISNIYNVIPHAKNQLIMLYDLQLNNRDEIFNFLEFKLKEIKRQINSNDLTFIEERMKVLNIFTNIINEAFRKPLIQTPILKLKINAPSNVIYNFINQLKNITIEEQKPFLSQNNKQLAEFLINYVEGFENASVETVSKEITRTHTIKKSSLLVKKIN